MRHIPAILPAEVCFTELDSYRDDLSRQLLESAEPFDAMMGILRAVYLAAHRSGVKVVLDGASSDVIFASDTLINGLMRRGEFGRALHEARGEEAVWGPAWPAWRAIARGAWHAFAPHTFKVGKERVSNWFRDRRELSGGMVRRQFAGRARLGERRRRWRSAAATSMLLDPRERVAWLTNGNLTVARERYDRVASSSAIEPRDPFIDLRVVRFSLSLPWSQLQRDGYAKLVLRNAMDGRLPDEVLWRKGRTHLGPDFSRSLVSAFPELSDSLTHGRETIGKYVDLVRVGCGGPIPTAPERFADWLTTVYLANWFETVARPIVRGSPVKGNDDAGR